ncbi:MAG: SusD/RagB family nutrient-binding outer membrane lipoprotein [Bacteroidota bacterium]|nr:SusD/RagB family nutrient-binding outer membrane lipoprotein [Bacteroidota bacterium]MDP4246292.1 SusD/RagB family nutrient-binding outer membrane lipoprotein [Bacteroidota bacterium]
MKRNKFLLLTILPAMVWISCKKSDFAKVNTNPATLTKVDPGNQFLQAANHYANDFEYYYDVYRSMMPWMQYSTNGAGNAPNFNLETGNFNYRYGNFYNNIGVPLADIPQLIAKMSPADQASRVYEKAIASIYMAYSAFYVSDINGSIVYTQGFKARYGGTLTPTYDPQATLLDTLDLQVKTAVATLESSQPNQILYGANYDPFYGDNAAGEVTEWIKAGNALRLQMAFRLMKRDPTKVHAIATEVLADAHQMSSIADSWVLYAGPAFADGSGNFSPTGFLAARPMVDFMVAKQDPRLSIFYLPNGKGQWIGSPTDPDTSALPVYKALYAQSDTPFATLQYRIFTPNYNDGPGAGNGIAFFPVITYAEYCFIRAEFAARGITSDNVGQWYTNGVTASIQFYDARAAAAKVTNYTPVTAGAIATYLAMPGIAFDNTKALDQIGSQAHLDLFREPSEAWAWWKMTGYPTTTSTFPWSPLTNNGTVLPLARRASLNPFPESDANYANQKAAYAAMAADPNFGSGPSDPFGRIWWDMP